MNCNKKPHFVRKYCKINNQSIGVKLWNKVWSYKNSELNSDKVTVYTPFLCLTKKCAVYCDILEFWLMPHLLKPKLSVGFEQDGASLHFHSEVIKFLAVPWLGWLAAGLSLWSPEFSPRPVHMGFVVDKVGLV